MLHLFLAMHCAFLTMHCAFLTMHCAFLTMHCPFPVMHCPFLVMHCPFLGVLRPFLAMLHAFAATRCEGEDAIHEESRGHHALHRVPDPSRGRGSACVGSDSARETTGPAYVGMPR